VPTRRRRQAGHPIGRGRQTGAPRIATPGCGKSAGEQPGRGPGDLRGPGPAFPATPRTLAQGTGSCAPSAPRPCPRLPAPAPSSNIRAGQAGCCRGVCPIVAPRPGAAMRATNLPGHPGAYPIVAPHPWPLACAPPARC